MLIAHQNFRNTNTIGLYQKANNQENISSNSIPRNNYKGKGILVAPPRPSNICFEYHGIGHLTNQMPHYKSPHKRSWTKTRG